MRCRRLTGPFPREEYEERLDRLRRVMVERRLDAVIVDTCEFEQTPRTSDFTRLFTAEADWRLEAGMVFHMYASADAGVAFSETVLVTDGGSERLTRTERRLLRCGEDAGPAYRVFFGVSGEAVRIS